MIAVRNPLVPLLSTLPFIDTPKRTVSHYGEEIARRDPIYPWILKKLHSRKRVKIIEEDWDNLVILDACRYDLFEETNTLSGNLERKVSQGSATPEFLRKNFSEQTYYDDIVYVTGIAQVHEVFETHPFVDVIDVWEFGWDSDHRTVSPQTMKEATLKAMNQYPNKRIISHWVQPHWPFIGPKAQEFLPDQLGLERSRTELLEGEDALAEDEAYPESVWGHLRKGHIEAAGVWDLYRENLDVALPFVTETVDEMVGKTVVTSDHGNLLGSTAWPYPFPIYGHPLGVHANALVEVPWLRMEFNERKKITPAPESQQRNTQDKDSETVKERLADLGYTQ